MARPRKSATERQSSSKTSTHDWAALTWADLDRWADSRSVARGRVYQQDGCVKKLAIMKEGQLLAYVTGTERYCTAVWIVSRRKRASELVSVCTCPLGISGCKHGVAVVAEHLAMLAAGKNTPTADPDDPRWFKVFGDSDDEVDEFEGDDDCDDEESEYQIARGRKGKGQKGKGQKGKRRTRGDWDKIIKTHIEQKSREDLAALVVSLVGRFPELRQELQERIELGEGDADRLMAQARRELHKCTAETGWRNHWDGEGYTPDYDPLKRRLVRLTESGHADAVLELGKELLSLGMEQVSESQDEGETAVALGECLDAVFDAVLLATIGPAEKILYVIDAYLAEDFDIIGPAADRVLDAAWAAADWSAVADALSARLDGNSGKRDKSEYSDVYRRDQLCNWLLMALEKGERKSETSALLEREARQTGSYSRLVESLIKQKRYDEAERWAREGIEWSREKYPGIASSLATSLCDVARKRKQWCTVAAHAALDFVSSPSVAKFQELAAAADKAKCADRVRTEALRFLETGVSPFQWSTGTKTPTLKMDPDFPLPLPDYLAPLSKPSDRFPVKSQPHYSTLLELAVAEKRPDEALRWFDKLNASSKSVRDLGWSSSVQAHHANIVAEAVARTHPKRALEIYQQRLDALLPQTGLSAYDGCADCLRKMRPIMKAMDRDDYWTELVADIRHNFRNRPRFMEILDKLDTRTIVQSQKASRRR